MKLYQKISRLIAAIENYKQSKNAFWLDMHQSELRRIERELLPSGSGFDAGCTIAESSTPEKLIIDAPFHHMNDVGYYVGWRDYTVVVRPSLLLDFKVTVRGKNINGLKDYVQDVLYMILAREVE